VPLKFKRSHLKLRNLEKLCNLLTKNKSSKRLKAPPQLTPRVQDLTKAQATGINLTKTTAKTTKFLFRSTLPPRNKI